MSFKDKFVGLFSEEEEEEVKEEKHKTKEKKEDDDEEIEIDFNAAFNRIKEFSNKEYIYYILLIPVLFLSLWIRLRNLSITKGKYLLGLDPYYFYRLTRYILENGHLMKIDAMRLAPLGVETPFRLFPYILAGWHKFASVFTGQPQLYSHVIYPPVFAVIGFFFFFLFVREIWDNKVALVATAFFAVTPAYLYRTIAGFADHEALAMLFLFSSLWLFVKFRKEDEIKRKLIFASLSGFLGSLMALVWPGVAMLTISIFVFVLFEILFERVNKKYFLGYLLWLLMFTLPVYLLTGINSLKSATIIVIFFPLLVFIVYFGLKKIKILCSKKISLSIFSIVISSILSVIGFFMVFNMNEVIRILTNPGGASRVSRTTSEIIGSSNLWGEFSWILIFAIFGGMYLLYECFKDSKKQLIIIECFAIISLTLLAFVKITGVLRIVNFSIVFGVIVLLYLYAYYKKEKNSKFVIESKIIYLLPLIVFMVTEYLSKTAARFVFIFAPFVCLMAGYFLVSAGKEIYSRKNLRLVSILVLIIIFGIFFSNANVSAKQAKQTGSNLMGQWESSMIWLRDNTPIGSTVSHWWDYGYWTQAVAERPSTQDGGKPGGSFFIYNLARYGMLAYDDMDALSYFKTNEVNYVLYSSEEIGKYHAFSYLASHTGPPGDYDRESVIGTFILYQQKEVRNGTLNTYTGGWAFDQDIVIDNLVLPENKAGVGAILATFDDNGKLLDAPEVIIVYNNKQFNKKLDCIYIGGEKQTWESNNSLDACIVFIDYYPNDQQRIADGGIVFLSSKVYPALFPRLYIMNEKIDGFEEVYTDNVPFAIYKNRIIGPIRIWNIDYPDYIKSEPERFHKEPEDFYEWYGY